MDEHFDMTRVELWDHKVVLLKSDVCERLLCSRLESPRMSDAILVEIGILNVTMLDSSYTQ